MRDYIEDRLILPLEQLGFRPGYNTTLQISMMANAIYNSLNHCISKAFHEVRHDALTLKLGNIGTPPHIGD